MWWFGGFPGPGPALRRPAGARQLWLDTPVWVSGQAVGEIRSARNGARRVVVFGPNAIPDQELTRLVTDGVPDDAAWRWPGSYTVVELSDAHTRIWTDLCMAQPIYTLRIDGGTAWASSARLLASLNDMRLDLDHLTRRLVIPGSALATATSTYFADVTLVPAGHRLSLGSSGECTSHPMWRPRVRPGEHARRLRSALTDAVALRVNTARAPAADFSGGFDSTALGLLAAEHLHPAGRSIVGVTVHPAGVETGGDLDYAREAARHPGLRHELLPLRPDDAPYQSLDALPASDEPAPSTVTFGALSTQLHWLADRFGCDQHMTGDGGDSLLSTPIAVVADLVRRGHLPRAVKETVLWARLHKTSLYRAWRSAHGSRNGCTTPCWLTPEASERLIAPTKPPSGYPVLDFSVLGAVMASMTEIGRSARSDIQIAETLGIQLHNPYTDSAVVDAYLSVPPQRLPSPSRYKPVMAEAMTGLFPHRLLRRTTKGDASSDHYHGLRTALPRLRTFMDGHLSEFGLIEPQHLNNTMLQAAAGTATRLYTIKNAVATEAWLRALRAAPPTAWVASDNGTRT